MSIITKELVDKLSDPDISKREYDNIIGIIEERVFDIWETLLRISKRKCEWYAFGNDVELERGNGSTGGEFDPIEYKEWIEMTGEYDREYNGYYDYDDGFPTRFLWTDGDIWQKEVLKNIEDGITKANLKKDNDNKKREEKKIKQKQMEEVIRNKLTKGELKYIKFIK